MHAQVPSPSRSRRTRAYVRTESQTVRRSIDRAPHPSINSLAPRKSYSTPRPAIGIYVGSRHPVHGRRPRRLGMPLYRWTRHGLYHWNLPWRSPSSALARPGRAWTTAYVCGRIPASTSPLPSTDRGSLNWQQKRTTGNPPLLTPLRESQISYWRRRDRLTWLP